MVGGQPREAVNEALDKYAKLLREEFAGLKGKDEDPLVGDPIGARRWSTTSPPS